jgi:hypothetical protein
MVRSTCTQEHGKNATHVLDLGLILLAALVSPADRMYICTMVRSNALNCMANLVSAQTVSTATVCSCLPALL